MQRNVIVAYRVLHRATSAAALGVSLAAFTSPGWLPVYWEHQRRQRIKKYAPLEGLID